MKRENQYYVTPKVVIVNLNGKLLDNIGGGSNGPINESLDVKFEEEDATAKGE